ncbi:hypothetical protein M0R45_035923 [Rubus argutus]|uniref:Uncharacterized protein n=1 Tax=Rubus argutus TaxID=59490 RepID=A0AAW1VXD8_RUBAR
MLIPCVLHHPSRAQPKSAMQSVHAAMLNSPSTRRHCFLRRRCNQTASLPVACSPLTHRRHRALPYIAQPCRHL